MFIDFLPLLLINMSAGLFMLACYGMGDINRNRPQWASGFGLVGTIATLGGFYLIFLFPLPGPYNIAFGDTSVMLGMLFLAGAWAIWKGISLTPLAIYSLFAGSVAVLIGIFALHRYFCQSDLAQFTKAPLLTATGFILTGIAGMCFGPIIWIRPLRWLRWPVSIGLIGAAFIWALTGLLAYWNHIIQYEKWPPLAR